MAAILYPLFDLTDYQARIRSIGTLGLVLKIAEYCIISTKWR